jgi:ankyrin repeat protein
VKLLLGGGADPNAKNDAGATALQWALRGGNTEIAQVLRGGGAKD